MGEEFKSEVVPTENEKWWSDLDKVTDMLWRDEPKEPVDILYFFGRSYFDASKKELYQMAVDLYKEKKIKKIIIPGTEGERLGGITPREAHPGKTLMKNRFVEMGVDEEDVVFSEPGYHTRQEGDAFLKYSIGENLHSAIALANPHQITRAMLGLIKAINDGNLSIDIYALTPNPNRFDWEKSVKGSQGLERKPRHMHIQDEIDRIKLYQEKGDLAHFDEALSYMARRGVGRKAA